MVKFLPKYADLWTEMRGVQTWTEQPTLPYFYLDILYAAPPKPAEGMVVMADGVTWNPGAGRGVYCYHGAAWAFLG